MALLPENPISFQFTANVTSINNYAYGVLPLYYFFFPLLSGLPIMLQAAYFYSTVFFTLFALVLSSPINTPDVVAVGYASFQGNTTEQGIIQFLGIPYAAPP